MKLRLLNHLDFRREDDIIVGPSATATGIRCTLRTRFCETRNQEVCLAVPGSLPESLSVTLREISSGVRFGYIRRHVPQVSCDQLFRLFFRTLLPSGAFRPFVVYSFCLPFFLHHVSSGSQSVGDAVVPKFDMHVNPSVLTSDEVNNLVVEYAIPLDLHPCVPPSGLTMNRLPADKIGALVLLRAPLDRYAIPDAMPWRHQDSSVADPPPTGVYAQDIRRLFATSMSQFLKFPMVGGVRVGKGTALAANEVIPQHTTPPLPSSSQIPKKSDHQRVVEVDNERVFAAKRKAQTAKDKVVGKRAAEGASQRTKKKKTTPLSFALSDSKADESNRSGSGTHHSASPLNTIIPNEDKVAASLLSEPVTQTEEGTDQPFDNSGHSDEDTQTVRSGPERTHASGSAGHGVSSTSGGSHRLAFPARHLGGDRAGSSLRRDAGSPELFVPAWNLTTHSILNDAESCQDMLGSREREERIQQLEADLASKTSSLTETKGVVGTLRGDLERLTVDLSQAEIVRHNYIHQLLPTVVQRLLSSDEYRKSLSDVFNLAIAAGWSEGVKAACSKEEAQAFLATAVDYDPACKETFMTEFDSLFDKSYPYVEKLAESFRLPLGDLQNMWPEGTRPTLSGNAAGASNTTDASNVAAWQ
ncbi:hypothetical protein Tco_1506776 [Tanacetum coccineum]